MAGKPSFLRDPDQAAELAALLQDTAEELENDLAGNRDDLTRRQLAQEEQTIAKYRRWAGELVTEPETEPAEPVQIRPARTFTDGSPKPEGATG
jgi:hypothetical protein